VRLTTDQIKGAAEVAKRLSDLRDEVPWPFVGDSINEVNHVVSMLEGWVAEPEMEDE
jgi:hypothetical protein